MHWVQLKLDSHDEMSLMLVPSNARIARSTNIRVRRIRCQIIDGGPSFLHSGIIGLLAQMTLTVCNNNHDNKNQSNDRYRVIFYTGTPPKSSKYRKVDLG